MSLRVCGVYAMPTIDAVKERDPGQAGVARVAMDRRVSVGLGQKVRLQRLSVPVSAAALSETRRFQVPFFGSLDRFTV